MEGVVDAITRDLLTRIGGIDQCTTEFIRVTDQLVPEKVFHRFAPELKTNSRTRAGVPVFVQLLGGDPVCLAENAAFAASLGAVGIDLNFGCPAKTVNRHDGGATLLLYPERIHKIVEAVRSAVPRGIPVTSKIRLGFSDPTTCLANAEASEAGGADWLTVHCRTKFDMYKPPAYWEWIPKIKERIKIPIVANGDIGSPADLDRCREVTGCDQFMIGRGVFADPFLFRRVRGLDQQEGWSHSLEVLREFFDLNWNLVSPRFAQARTKQWLRSLQQGYDEAAPLFDQLKVVTKPEQFRSGLFAEFS
jgi:tRNA-dihydrouridine synthase C